MDDFLKCVNYGTVDTDKKYNYQAANKFRHQYDSLAFSSRNREKEGVEMEKAAIESAYCFAQNVKSTRKADFTTSIDDFKKANDIIKAEYYSESSKLVYKQSKLVSSSDDLYPQATISGM